MKKSLGSAAVLAAAIAAGGIASAAIPRADGTIVACRVVDGTNANPSGSLRVVEAKRECTRNERVINWSQTGPAGLQGPAGADGADGAEGETGPAGPQGPPGADGSAPVLIDVSMPVAPDDRTQQYVATVGGVDLYLACRRSSFGGGAPFSIIADVRFGAPDAPSPVLVDGVWTSGYENEPTIWTELHDERLVGGINRNAQGMVRTGDQPYGQFLLSPWEDETSCHLDGWYQPIAP